MGRCSGLSWVPAARRALGSAKAGGYNCFAWAVGSTSGPILYGMLADAGFGPDVTGFTGYLEAMHGFGRHADGLDASADLILYGETPSMVLHAARKADEPFEALTFSSKLGGGTDQTPVILHAPPLCRGGATALRCARSQGSGRPGGTSE